MTPPSPMPLQSLIWPEIGLCTERDLYVRLRGGAALSLETSVVHFVPGAVADFGTYYNLFNIGKWHKHCGLETLSLALEGDGRFELVVFHARPDRSWERLVNEVITLKPGQPHAVALTLPDGFANRGVLFFELQALEAGTLHQAHWQTSEAPKRRPDLMLSVTTFRREAAVARTAERFAEFIAQSQLKDHIHLSIVDNGQSAEIPKSPHVTLIGNENLGGSGGFARGLLEAQRRGASHCLFMDDDASVHMEAIERTWMFLAYATDPKTAIAGAVSNAQHRWQLWENGARFDRLCRPQHMGLDLRDMGQVLALEFDSSATQPDDFYGGWWYFAFAVDAVQHMPFPFFVRGDDVSFSLVHDFNIVTLPGVISYQDEDFSVKETPLTVYLDLRSHLAHHLSLPSMEIGRKGLAQIMLRFWIRSLLDCHYETLEAVALALEDVRKGPDYFAQNADMASRRGEIGKLTQIERWQPIDERPEPGRHWFSPHRRLPRMLMKATLNGHLLPGFGLIGNVLVLPAAERGARRPIWGASEITYVSIDGKRAYTVRHNKARALRVSLRILGHIRAILRDYEALRKTWHAGYQTLTGTGFWHEILKLDPPAEDSKAPAAKSAG
ncbi:MAG: hypothetical protein QNJ09_01845 [Paracoccaceae bacterium]|nr:hypothetical protein [Paracoccaceae bacterium]